MAALTPISVKLLPKPVARPGIVSLDRAIGETERDGGGDKGRRADRAAQPVESVGQGDPQHENREDAEKPDLQHRRSPQWSGRQSSVTCSGSCGLVLRFGTGRRRKLGT